MVLQYGISKGRDPSSKPKRVELPFYLFCIRSKKFRGRRAVQLQVNLLRTGSVGNRTAEEMVKTLVEPKKAVVSHIREKLLGMGYTEEVEYDAINIEPVLVYSKSERSIVFLRHKWELCASIPFDPKKTEEKQTLADLKVDVSKYQTKDEEGNMWLRFELPKDQDFLFLILGNI